ncbi:hypothetical protein LJR015_002648 [Peribacillus frigoritolerans]
MGLEEFRKERKAYGWLLLFFYFHYLYQFKVFY